MPWDGLALFYGTGTTFASSITAGARNNNVQAPATGKLGSYRFSW